MASTPLDLIDVHTSEGVTGRSYLRSYTPLALAAPARLVSDLGAEFDRPPADPDAATANLRATLRLLGTTGLAGAASPA